MSSFISNPHAAADAVSNPAKYIEDLSNNQAEAFQDTSLSSGGVSNNPLAEFAKILAGTSNTMSAGDLSGGVSTNPYTGGYAPVSDRQVADYSPPQIQSSQPTFNPNTGTSRTSTPSSSSVGSNDGYWDGTNAGGNLWDTSLQGYSNFSPSTQSQRGLFSSSSDGRTDLGFGVSYNTDAWSNNFNPTSAGSWKNRGEGLVDFGNTSIMGGLGFGDEYKTGMNALGKIGQFSALTGDYDTARKARELGQTAGMFGLTGNRAWDMATKGTVLEYANDPLTPRSMLGAAVNKAGFGYGGLTMTGLDYLQGYNPDTGSLYRSGAYALNPVVGGVGDLFNVWGDVGTKAGSFTADPTKAQTLDELNKGYYSRFNENFGTYEGDKEVADYLAGHGIEKGTHQYDMAVNAYNKAMDEKNPYGQGFRDSMEEARANTYAVNKMNEGIEQRRAEEAAIEKARAEVAAAEAANIAMSNAKAAQAAIAAENPEQAARDAAYVGTASDGYSATAERYGTAPGSEQTAMLAEQDMGMSDSFGNGYGGSSGVGSSGTYGGIEFTSTGNLRGGDLSISPEVRRAVSDLVSETVSEAGGPSNFSLGSFSGPGGTDVTGATQDDYNSYDNPDDSSGPSGGGSSGGGGGGSYIATAATQALGEEGLTIFENWRDYMFDALPTFTTSYGRYRVTAPKIVAEIDKKDNSKEIYSWIWDMHLKPIFNMITEDRDSKKALKDYKIMVKELQNRFLKERA